MMENESIFQQEIKICHQLGAPEVFRCFDILILNLYIMDFPESPHDCISA